MKLKRLIYTGLSFLAVGLTSLFLGVNGVSNIITQTKQATAGPIPRFIFASSERSYGALKIVGVENKSDIIDVSFPTLYNNKPVVEIGDDAFKGCNKLKTVSMNNSNILIVGNHAFSNLPELTTVVLPPNLSNNDLASNLGEGVFENCPKLTNLTLPNNERFTKIPKRFLAYDEALESLTINRWINNIDQEAFIFCHFKSFTIEDRITQLNFSSEEEKFPMYGSIIDILNFSEPILNRKVENNQPLWVFKDANLFYGCKLKNVELIDDALVPANEKWIPHYNVDADGNRIGGYFEDYGGEIGYKDLSGLAFGNIILNNNKKQTNEFYDEALEGSFVGNWSLDEVTIPNNVSLLTQREWSEEQYGLFDTCDAIRAIHLSYTLADFNDSSKSDKLYGLINPQHFHGSIAIVIHPQQGETFANLLPLYQQHFGTEKIVYIDGSQPYDKEFTIVPNSTASEDIYIKPINKNRMIRDISVPVSVNGQTVNGIDANAFKDCIGLRSIYFPNNINKIKSGAFDGCKLLTNVKLPESLDTVLSADLFAECSSLKTITIPYGVTRISARAFQNCTSLTTVTFKAILDFLNFNKTAFDNDSALKVMNIESNDISDASEDQQNINEAMLLSAYRSLTNVPETITINNWFNHSYDDISGSIYNYTSNNVSIRNNFNEGFKEYANAHPHATYQIQVQDNPYLEFGATFDWNNTDPTQRVRLAVSNVKKLNTVNYDATLTCTLIVNDGNEQKQVQLKAINIHLDPATNTFSLSSPSFIKNTVYARNENGLWLGGDSYNFNITADMACFGNDWNSTSNIVSHFDQYLSFTNGAGNTITFTKLADGTFFNNTVGKLQVTNIQKLENHRYLINVSVYVPNKEQNMRLIDQTITINFINANNANSITIQTFAPNHFEPVNRTIYQLTDPVELDFNQDQANVNWNLATQEEFSYIAKNSFVYWRNKNYTFRFNHNGFSHQNISLANNITLSDDGLHLQSQVNLIKQPLNDLPTININNLSISIMNGNNVIATLPLPALTINVFGAISDQKIVKAPTLTKNPIIDVYRDGLWATGDYYNTVLKINKAIFVNHEQDSNYILKHFDEFITVRGNNEQTYNWDERTHLSNVYFSPYIGQLTVNSITSVDQYHYQIDLTISKPNEYYVTYQTQELFFKFKATKKELFKIKTINANDLDVHYYPLEKNFDLIKLNHDHRSQYMVYHSSDQTQFSDLVGNTFKWAKLKGYRFEIDSSNFNNKYLSIDKVASFNPNNNTLSFGVTQILASLIEQKDVLVDGLVLKIIDNHNNTYQTINLKYFKVEIAKAYSDVNGTQPVYNGSNHTSLNNNGDYSKFDLLIPSVLIPASGDRYLISSIKVHYENEPNVNWDWKYEGYSNGVYIFSSKGFKLTYQRISESGSKINKIITYHFTLTKLFDGDKKKDIYLNIKNADFGTVHIENDQYKEPEIDPHPALTIFIKWLPVIGGTLGGIGFISLIGYFIYRHNRFKNYVIHEYRNKKTKKRR